MPEIDIDAAMECLLPWDLTIKCSHALYSVRPITIRDMVQLEAAAKEASNIQSLRDILESMMLRVHGSDFGAIDWSIEALLGIVTVITAYWSDQAKKNSGRVREAMKAQLGTGGSTPGNSTGK